MLFNPIFFYSSAHSLRLQLNWLSRTSPMAFFCTTSCKICKCFFDFFLRPFTFCIFEVVVLLAIIVLKEALLSTSFCGLRKIILCVIARPKSYRSSRHSSEKKALCLVKILAKCFKIFHTHMLTKIFIVFQKHGFCKVLLLS